jgi:hypothetical protein
MFYDFMLMFPNNPLTLIMFSNQLMFYDVDVP